MTTRQWVECVNEAPSTLRGEQTSAGEATSLFLWRQLPAGDLPPHGRRRARYLEPRVHQHKVLLRLQVVVHVLREDEPHGALEQRGGQVRPAQQQTRAAPRQPALASAGPRRRPRRGRTGGAGPH